MHPEWADDVARRLRAYTTREIRIRPHPGNWQKEPPRVPLVADLEGCWAMVTWASSAGVHALLAGVPVIREAPWWILAGAASSDIRAVEHPPEPDRLPAFVRLAWAQYNIEEIAAGLPFEKLRPL